MFDNKNHVITNKAIGNMDCSSDPEYNMPHSFVEVKLERLDDYNLAHDSDPSGLDNNVNIKIEQHDSLLGFESGEINQLKNTIKEDNMTHRINNTTMISEEIYIKSEFLGNESSTNGDLGDSRRDFEDNQKMHNSLIEKSSRQQDEYESVEIKKEPDEKNSTRCKLTPSYNPLYTDIINKESMEDKNVLDVSINIPVECLYHSGVISDSRNSKDDSLTIQKLTKDEVIQPSPNKNKLLMLPDAHEKNLKKSKNLVNENVVHTNENVNEFSLAKHKRNHASQQPYICDICKKEFKTSSHMTLHKRIHTGQKPYVCEVCKKEFNQSSHLVSHSRVHTGQKPYLCDICRKAFSLSSNLTKHKLIHTGNKPYVCDICNKGFNHLCHLTGHKRIHNSQKAHVCDICKKQFRLLSYLISHKRIHTGQKPYACDICDKSFTHSFNLATHKRIHTGQKPYVCDVCQKGFSQQSNLVSHKRTHFGHKPYVCDICQMGFSRSTYLTVHKHTHSIS